MFFLWPIIAIILTALGWKLLFAELDGDRRDAENFALAEVMALSRSYAAHLNRSIDAIDQIIRLVRLQWETSNGLFQLENAKAKGIFPEAAPFNISINDRNGIRKTSTFSSSGEGNSLTNVSDRKFFQVQKSATGDFLYIGPPIIGRTTGKRVIQFSRRLSDSSGNFDGTVLVSVEADYFTENYDETTLGKHGLLGVMDTDGTVRVMRTGQTVHAPESGFLLPGLHFDKPSGSVFLDGPKWFSDKRSRYIGWQAVDGTPFIALTGLDQQERLAPYWENRATLIRNAIGASIALAAFTLIAMALSLQLARRKHQMELTQTTYRMATEEGNEGFYIMRPIRDHRRAVIDFEVIDCNQRGAEMFRRRREDFIGMRISTLYGGEDFERTMQTLCRAMNAGFYEGEQEQLSGSPIVPRWVHIKIIRSNDDLAVTLRDISDSKAHVEELERRSNEDALTRLPNRHWVHACLPRAIENARKKNEMLAVLFIDLDGFKAVNDAMGHSAGDELLRHAAHRLKVAVRPHDDVVRFGGDEFLVILEHIMHKEDAAHVAQRVLHAFQDGFKLPQGVQRVGTSIGISVFPTDGSDADTLLQNADIAMYSVKTSGKGSYRFYDPKFYESLRTRLEREAELRRAIERDEFIVYYQPLVNMSTGATSSMEALLRWQHPSQGLLEPLDFIPLAEETGLILGLGELVIDKVCAQLSVWTQKGRSVVPVSVNVSSRQFNEAGLSGIFSSALERHNVAPELVEIELTESSVMGESQDVLDTLNAVQAMGMKLLVDDFGTGYSSLSQLQRLDFDVLKVDRAFTSQIEKTEEGKIFFTAIITMAHALGMRVVAEGVENLRQIKILKSLDCDEIQGFYISRPLPATEMQPFSRKWWFPSIA
ncbi:MAG: hypothetical protein JWQ21_8 [Herminiimonas sp.]|nr:hypothetical protein [Herminiimonas sp.]